MRAPPITEEEIHRALTLRGKGWAWLEIGKGRRWDGYSIATAVSKWHKGWRPLKSKRRDPVDYRILEPWPKDMPNFDDIPNPDIDRLPSYGLVSKARLGRCASPGCSASWMASR